MEEVCVPDCLCEREDRGVEWQFATLLRLDYFIVWCYYNFFVKLMRGRGECNPAVTPVTTPPLL